MIGGAEGFAAELAVAQSRQVMWQRMGCQAGSSVGSIPARCMVNQGWNERIEAQFS